jgi:hypothetical protein
MNQLTAPRSVRAVGHEILSGILKGQPAVRGGGRRGISKNLDGGASAHGGDD